MVVMKAIESGKFNCIVIDSLTNLKTRDDMQKEDGEGPRMGQRAQVMNNFLVKLNAKLMKNEVAVVVISQERESMDLFKKDPVLPGGASVLYSSSVIMGLMSNKSEEIKDKETGLKIGQKTRVRLRKNRFGADNCEFTCKIMFQDPNGGIKK
jgi:RecA/RadA recombinase